MSATVQRARTALAHPAAGAALVTVGVSGTQGLIGLLTARWLGPTDRGVVVTGVTASSLLLLLGGLGLPPTLRMTLARPQGGLSFRGMVVLVAPLVALVCLPLALLAAGVLRVFGDVHRPLTLLAFAAFCVVAVCATLLREGLHGTGRHRWAVGGDLLSAVVLLGSVGVLRATDRLGVESYFVAATLGGLCGIALLLTCGWRDPDPPGTRPRRGALLRLSRGSLAWALLAAFAWKGDRLLLGLVTDPTQVGVYGTAATLSDVAWLVPVAMSTVLARRVSAEDSAAMVPRWRRRMLGLTALAAVPVGVLGTVVLTRLLGPGYAGGVPALWLLLLGTLALTSYQADLAGCQGLGRFRAGWQSALAGSVTLVALAPPLALALGGTGCALASVVAYAAMAVVCRRQLLALLPTPHPRGPETP
ncbi:lipopolysaccharide biosynthesis protein [Lapillicoccus jejuensis]|uniref:O-antigen/teichoic acid export membrane protein n=1 Tax=Lapillicoccus jejuensis TaxID=402171 RepID=A0A542DVZ9_9MICO|nr:oligosaccharide flippase family protein [Lapillicoccus jejuensis]TQJ07278.1 O-antigen/teichoic acid export membrane protein [Lapillicoccus jejuensis]